MGFKGKNMPLTVSALISPPRHLCGITRTVHCPLAYFTGEETEALRGSVTCPRLPEPW